MLIIASTVFQKVMGQLSCSSLPPRAGKNTAGSRFHHKAKSEAVPGESGPTPPSPTESSIYVIRTSSIASISRNDCQQPDGPYSSLERTFMDNTSTSGYPQQRSNSVNHTRFLWPLWKRPSRTNSHSSRFFLGIADATNRTSLAAPCASSRANVESAPASAVMSTVARCNSNPSDELRDANVNT